LQKNALNSSLILILENLGFVIVVVDFLAVDSVWLWMKVMIAVAMWWFWDLLRWSNGCYGGDCGGRNSLLRRRELE
jgi:hypothetical protein